MAITANNLLTGIKRRVSMPANQFLLEDDDILKIADDVILSDIVPIIMSLRENYFVTMEEVSSVANQAEYNIPERSMGNGLRDLKVAIDSTDVRDMHLYTLEDAHMSSLSSQPLGFYFQADQVVVVPTPAVSTYTFQMFYHLPPAALVLTSAAAQIVSIAGDVVTVGSVPSGITASASVDFIRGKQGYRTYSMDNTVQGVTSNTITFAADVVPDSAVAGDWITLSQTSPLVQLPNSCYRLLETRAAATALDAIGDYEGSDKLMERSQKEEENLKIVLAPRIYGEQTKIINRNGLLRGRRPRYIRGSIF